MSKPAFNEDVGDMADVRGPFGHSYCEVASILKRYRNERIVFISNKGNAGDSLINLGAMLFMRRNGIEFELGSRTGTFRDRVVVCGGGGNLIEPYTGMKRVIERNAPVCTALVLLPHTVRSYGGLLSQMDRRVTLFAREKTTYAFLGTHAGQADVRLAHDMALYVDPDDILRWSARMMDILRTRRTLRRYLVRQLRLQMLRLHRVRHGRQTICCFRTDTESAGSEKIASAGSRANFDLSYLMASESMMEVENFMTVQSLFRSIRPFRAVETDRLHIAISSALLGRNVIMHDNSYGKNRDIYEHSLKDYFPDIDFRYPKLAD